MKKKLSQSLPAPAGTSGRRKLPFLLAIMACLFFPILCLNGKNHPTMVSTSQIAMDPGGKWLSTESVKRYGSMSIREAMSESDEEAQKLVVEVLSPLIGHLKTAYPIESVRKEFVKISTALPIITTVAPKYNSIAFTGHPDPECKKSAIFINAVNVRIRLRWALVTFGEQAGIAYMEDLLAMMILHEGYHALNQGFIGQAEAEKVYHYEAECWIYTCQMIERIKGAGRGDNLLGGIASMLETAIYEQYQKSGRPEKVTPDWAVFIKSCYVSL
ncbi:MAG: hypothetical protein NTY66_04180 [Candidatus Vogelbacteria bacterium]|nr:hypothetical protein [Candidatus Vogelbacteria bacterium]